jgi:hypothetical protein
VNDNHPLFSWLDENAGHVAALQQEGFTKAAAVQILLLFDIASFVAPEEICDDCRKRLDEN